MSLNIAKCEFLDFFFFLSEVEFTVVAGKLVKFIVTCRKVKQDYIDVKDAKQVDSGEHKTLDCKEGYGIFTMNCAPGDDPNLDPPEHKLMSTCTGITEPKKNKPKPMG